jgi:hypothetical protein
MRLPHGTADYHGKVLLIHRAVGRELRRIDNHKSDKFDRVGGMSSEFSLLAGKRFSPALFKSRYFSLLQFGLESLELAFALD